MKTSISMLALSLLLSAEQLARFDRIHPHAPEHCPHRQLDTQQH